MGAGKWLFRSGSEEREKEGIIFISKKAGEWRHKIATALPEHPVCYPIGLHMFFLLGMRAYS